MRTYILTTPNDADGQPRHLFKANFENNVSKAIDQLSGICSGILADGVVNEQEARFFADYVQKFAEYEPIWPFTDILDRVKRIFADGVCDAEEREELKLVMQALCGHKDDVEAGMTRSTSLPFNTPLPTPVIFPERSFVVTGKFAYGPRRAVMDAINKLDGIAGDSTPTNETHYLVVGVFASRDWAHSNYGRKIERAVELREKGSGISIISEDHWRSFIESRAA
jgi:NAD-dependent DNA ligase